MLEPDLRAGPDSQYIRHIGEGYAFDVNSDTWLDTLAFEQALSEGLRWIETEVWAEAIEALESAVALYRGEFLSEDCYAEWAEAARAHLRERHLGGLGRLAACYAQLGRHWQTAACCRKALVVDPCREEAARQLMSALGELGHPAQAMQAYEQLGARCTNSWTSRRPQKPRSIAGSSRRVHPWRAGRSIAGESPLYRL